MKIRTLLIAAYAYDGMFRRTTKVVGTETRSYYYNDQWKCVEERSTGSPSSSSSSSSANANSSSSSSNANSPSSSGSSLVVVTSGEAEIQYVWGARPNHRDELILRDRDTSGNGVLDERLYCLMDYYDPTSIVDTNGDVVERYRFSAFGVRTIFSPTWAEQSTSNFDFDFGFHGQFLDEESGYYDYGYRYYSPELGRWLNRDPIAEDGGAHLYGFVENDGVGQFDILGLVIRTDCSIWAWLTSKGVTGIEVKIASGPFDYFTSNRNYSDIDAEILSGMINSEHTFVFNGSTSESQTKIENHVKARKEVPPRVDEQLLAPFGQGWGLPSQLLKDPNSCTFMCRAARERAQHGRTVKWVRTDYFIPGDAGHIYNTESIRWKVEGSSVYTGKNKVVGQEGQNIVYLGGKEFYGHIPMRLGARKRSHSDWVKLVAKWGNPQISSGVFIVIDHVDAFIMHGPSPSIHPSENTPPNLKW